MWPIWLIQPWRVRCCPYFRYAFGRSAATGWQSTKNRKMAQKFNIAVLVVEVSGWAEICHTYIRLLGAPVVWVTPSPNHWLYRGAKNKKTAKHVFARLTSIQVRPRLQTYPIRRAVADYLCMDQKNFKNRRCPTLSKRPKIAHIFWYHFQSIRVALSKGLIGIDWTRKIKYSYLA